MQVQSYDQFGVIGELSFRNEYDGHTIDRSLEQVKRISGKELKRLAGDRGYRGKKKSGVTEILIPDIPKATDSYYKRCRKRKLFCKRAGIEPTIGHLKSDFRLGRNFYKGVFGDNINIMLAAAAYNFKNVMRLLLCLVRALGLCLERLNMTTIPPLACPCANYNENKK